MARIRLAGVSKRYNGIVAVLNMTMEIYDGEFFAVLGPPGAGKTSTLKIIAGVEPVTSGQIFFDEDPIESLPPNKRNVAMVFESYALYPHLTVFENIAYPLRRGTSTHRFSEAEIKDAVGRIAELLQISPTLQRQPAQLSGGQRQRVALARALIRNPKVFLFDEPIAHLDARLRHELRAELKRLQRVHRITTVYATPDYAEAIAMADRVAVLFGGEIKQVGTPEEILRSPASAEVAQFLGDPPINILPAQIKRHDNQTWLDLGGVEISAPPTLKSWAIDGKLKEQVLVGIRAGDVVLRPKSGPTTTFCAEVYSSERLHRKTVVTLTCGKDQIRMNAPSDFRTTIGESFWLEFPSDRLLTFDPETHLALHVRP